MHHSHLKKIFLSALGLALAVSGFASGKKGSVGLDLSAANSYLCVQGSASAEIDSRALSAIGLSYENSRSSGVKAMETTLSLDLDGESFFGGVALNYGNDDQTRNSLGGKLSVGAIWEYAKGFEATLTLSGGPTRFSASQSVSNSAAVLPLLRKRSVSASETITQWNPSIDLNLSFFDSTFSVSGAFSDYRYQGYAAGSGLAGTATRDAAAASLNNVLMSGFADWQWSVGLGIKLPWKISLNSGYAESLDLDSQEWSRSLSGTLSKDFGDHFHALAGLTHALAGGSGDNTIRAGLTYSF